MSATDNKADVLKDPIVRGLLESYQREIEQMKLDAEMWAKACIAGSVGMIWLTLAAKSGAPIPAECGNPQEIIALYKEALRQLNETNDVASPEYFAVIERVREAMKGQRKA